MLRLVLVYSCLGSGDNLSDGGLGGGCLGEIGGLGGGGSGPSADVTSFHGGLAGQALSGIRLDENGGLLGCHGWGGPGLKGGGDQALVLRPGGNGECLGGGSGGWGLASVGWGDEDGDGSEDEVAWGDEEDEDWDGHSG